MSSISNEEIEILFTFFDRREEGKITLDDVSAITAIINTPLTYSLLLK
jgi:hypothetical protein